MKSFDKNGKHTFAAIATLALEFFAKMDCAAIQERMFSVAKAVMGKHQSRIVIIMKKSFLNHNIPFMGCRTLFPCYISKIMLTLRAYSIHMKLPMNKVAFIKK